MCHKIILDDKLCQEDLNVQCATRSYWKASSIWRNFTNMYHKIILDGKLCQEDLTYICHKIILDDKLFQEELNAHVPHDQTG